MTVFLDSARIVLKIHWQGRLLAKWDCFDWENKHLITLNPLKFSLLFFTPSWKAKNKMLSWGHDMTMGKNKTTEYVAKMSCKFSPTHLYLVGLMVCLIKERCSFILVRILHAKLCSSRGLSDDCSVVAFQAISLTGQLGIPSHTQPPKKI